ncbi:hypothetical protein Q8F55_005398 [Vanrija albida]|uniref:Asparaginase n=1 Tax=Vanrija albida TaxID=181172 RepID=A0ABR3Q1K5_9TREE
MSTPAAHTRAADAVVSDRSGIVENRHLVHAAVADAGGALLFSLGDPARPTLIRSAAKPAQGLAVLTVPGMDSRLSDEDVALMCASHSSEDAHVARARDLLRRSGVGESALSCGGDKAISEAVNAQWIRAGLTPTGIHNNCSGKHAAMILASEALGAGHAGYELPGHPIQERVRLCVSAMAGLPQEDIQWGIDGCNLPAPALPLRNLARMYAVFARSSDARREGAQANGAPPEVPAAFDAEKAMARVFDAMAANAYYVGGDKRFCTDLMDAYGGDVIGKVGADGCYGVGIRAGASPTREPLGIAVKIEDGDRTALYAAVCEILERLGVGSAEQRAKLDAYHHIARLNSAGVKVGTLSFAFDLRDA